MEDNKINLNTPKEYHPLHLLQDPSLNLNKNKSSLDFQNLNLNSSFDEPSLDLEKQKFKINEIINYLYYEFHSIDLFSTNELERIIIFSNYNKQKTMSLLENYTKEEIIKMIEDFNLKNIKKSKSADWSQILPKKLIEVYQIINKKYSIQINNNNQDYIWSFINNHVNLIDLKDLLNTYDHYKLIKKAKSIVKDKDNKKLSEYFEKFYELREKKCKEIFKANLEQNDLNFLEGDNYMENEVLKKQKKMIMNNLTENLIKNNSLDNFNKLFTNSNEFVKSHIVEYLDIFSIGKFGLVNKNLNNFIYNKFSIENIAKLYCLAIFKNSNNYLNNQEILKLNYKNFTSMLTKRPRIRYGGIYYSKVRYNKVGDVNSVGDTMFSTVTYYRIYRFMPNGDIYCITTPNVKSNKLMTNIRRNNLEFKSGRFFVEADDTLIVELSSGNDKSHVYKYKFSTMKEMSGSKFNTLELSEYMYKNGLEVINMKLTENFPKLFKFRSLDVLKNEVSLYKTFE